MPSAEWNIGTFCEVLDAHQLLEILLQIALEKLMKWERLFL